MIPMVGDLISMPDSPFAFDFGKRTGVLLELSEPTKERLPGLAMVLWETGSIQCFAYNYFLQKVKLLGR